MEIRPATISQFATARNGRMIPIEDDVQNVANGLNEIDHHFRLRYSEAGDFFVVYWKPDEAEEGDGYLVTTAQELDQRIVKRVEEIYWRTLNDPTYSLADELERHEAEKEKAEDARRREIVGPIAEKLAFTMRKELGYNDGRMFVPGKVADAKGA